MDNTIFVLSPYKKIDRGYLYTFVLLKSIERK